MARENADRAYHDLHACPAPRPGRDVAGSPARLALAVECMMGSLVRALILAGLALLVIGFLLSLMPRIPLLGRLPGDIRIERPGLRLYLPITTCLLVSLVLSALLWLLTRRR